MTNEEALKIAKIHPELEDAVFRNMSPDLDKAESIFYVYAKLCSILNYDPEFWASGQNKGPKKEAHIHPEAIENITPNNPEVVCYDFNLIFGKLLDKLDVKYKIGTRTGESNTEYGLHTDVVIDFLPYYLSHQKDVDINSEEAAKLLGEHEYSAMYSVWFRGYDDMKKIKVDKTIGNQLGRNDDQDFEEYIQKTREGMVNNVLSEQEAELAKREKLTSDEQRIQTLGQELKGLTPDFISIGNREAVEMFFEQVSKLDMNRYDASYYIGKLFKNMMPKDKEYIFTYSIMKEKSKDNKDLYNMTGMVNICSDTYDYYAKITPPNKVEVLSRDDVQAEFTAGMLDYLGYGLPTEALLPNIRSKYAEENFKSSISGISNYVYKNKNNLTIPTIYDLKHNMDILPDERIILYSKNFGELAEQKYKQDELERQRKNEEQNKQEQPDEVTEIFR
ncbi:MAG: hypothetical protein IKQ31_00870 [Clostridia bacterium]|nr:hypothetical protein [Clostridia bacterium]